MDSFVMLITIPLAALLAAVLAGSVFAGLFSAFKAAVTAWETAEQELAKGKRGQVRVDRIEAKVAADEAARVLSTYVRNEHAASALDALENAASQVLAASIFASGWRMDGAPSAPNVSPDAFDYERWLEAESVNEAIAHANRTIATAHYEAVSMMAECRQMGDIVEHGIKAT